MIYLTYDEYSAMGGICDLTAFNRNIDRACGVIDNCKRLTIQIAKHYKHPRYKSGVPLSSVTFKR